MTKYTVNTKTICSNKANHTPEPEGMGYVQWHEWAEKMSETHKQVRCPECKLYVIWVLK